MPNVRLEVAEGWATWKFDEIAQSINDRVDNPVEAGVTRYVGLEHLDPGEVALRRWGSPGDVSATKLRFQAGDVIYGRRRAYQRKLAVAPFEGIASAHALILRARSEVCLPEFLPYFLQSDAFHERALAISVGSLSPTINWKTLKVQEFALPPLEEQKRAVGLITALDSVVLALAQSEEALAGYRKATIHEALLTEVPNRPKAELGDLCNVVVGPAFRSQVFRETKEGPAILRGANIGAEGLRWDEVVRWPAEDASSYSDYELAAGDVCVAMDATFTSAGEIRLGTVAEKDLPLLLNQRVARLRPNGSLPTELLVAVLQSGQARRHLLRRQTGAFAPHVSASDLRTIQINLPSPDEQVRIRERLLRIEAMMNHLAASRSSLAVLRKAIMSETFGGNDV